MHACFFRKQFSHDWFLSNRFHALRPRLALSHLACLLLVAFAALTSAQTTIHVPADQPTIQAGINAANNGDTVLVAPGTYYENIDFKGKAITVTSASGAVQTILDGSKGSAPTVSFITAEPRTATLNGFTIQGGGIASVTVMGGIYINQAKPTLTNDIITQNQCYSVWAYNGSPLIQNSNINNTLNEAGCTLGGGSAIYIDGTVDDTTPSFIFGNTIEDNTQAGSLGSAIGGAAFHIEGANPIIENNIIRNNQTHNGNGGAFLLDGGTGFGVNQTLIIQNLIYGNQAGAGGGAIAIVAITGAPYAYIANNVIVDNTYTNEGGQSIDYPVSQIYAGNGSVDGDDVVFVNNIIAGDTAEAAIHCDKELQTPDEASQPIFDHNILLNKGGSIFTGQCVDVSAKYGNIVADPMFVNWTGNNYQLQSGSPAIDAGNTSILQSLPYNYINLPSDFGGNPRVTDATGKGYPVIDIGAYEYAGMQDAQPTTIVLTPSEYEVFGGTELTLTAQIVSTGGTPTGSIAFLEDGNLIGTVPIDSSGQAVFPSPPLAPGTHNFIAVYPAPGATNSTLPPARSVVVIVVAYASSTTLTLTSSLNPSKYGVPVTFTVNLSAPDGVPTGQVTVVDTTTNTTLATLTPDANGNANFSTSNLAMGANYLTASYAGDSNHAAASAQLEQVTGVLYIAGLQPLASPSPSTVGQAVTFTAIVTSNYLTPTGSVNFLDGTTLLGTGALVNGTATFSTSSLAAGTHTILMDYPPNSTWFGVEEPLTQTVNGSMNTTSTALTASPNPAYALQSVTLSAKITTTATGTPTGTVAFNDGGTLLGTANLAANGTATLPVTFAAVSATPHQLTATYSGDATFNSSTSAAWLETVQFNSTTTLITTMVPNPVDSFAFATLSAIVSSSTSPGNAPTGAITFTAGGKPLGTGTLVNGTVSVLVITPAPGSYPVIANYSGDTAFFPSPSPSQTLIVIPDVVSVALKSSENPSVYGDSVTLTASLSLSTANPAPLTGTITFLDGKTQIGRSVQVDSTGTATYTTATLAVGKHPLTAVYSGNADVTGATSPVVNQVVQPYAGDFTLSITPGNAAVYTGGRAGFTITATPENGFNLPLLLSCSSLPANAKCVFAPARISSDPPEPPEYFEPYISFLQMETAPPSPQTSAARQSKWTGGVAALACLCGLLMVPRRIRRALHMRSILIGVLLIGAFAAISGCGGVGSLTGGTPPGTYEITITAKPPASLPQVSHTVKIKLVVKSLF